MECKTLVLLSVVVARFIEHRKDRTVFCPYEKPMPNELGNYILVDD